MKISKGFRASKLSSQDLKERESVFLIVDAKFPILAQLVRVVFATPCASSKSERVFSACGNTVTPKRASLLPEKVY